MKELISVTNSDTVNLYGSRFTIGALVQGTHDTCLLGIPTTYGHDSSKPIGWTFPLGIYFESGISRSVAITQLIETEEDRAYLLNLFNHYYSQEVLKPNKSNIDKLKALLGDCLEGNEEIIIGEAVSVLEKNLVKRKFPEILSLCDKDGLISMRNLEPVGDGVFKKGDFLLFADGYFRRSFYPGNALNSIFLKKLMKLDQNNVTVKIAIDQDLVGLAEAYFGEKMELEYWWGPKFDDDLVCIPNGVTLHEADEDQRLSSGISRTEFRWGNMSEMKVFEVEELRDVPANPLTPDIFSCRYAHAMVNIESGIVEHFDGAIRSYNEEEMADRLDTSLDKAARNTDYKKLWRVDGGIDVCTWKSLLSDYFRNNPLVGEYLGAEDEAMKNRKKLEKPREKSIKEQYVPFSLSENSGLRIALSFIPRKRIPDNKNLAVIPLDSFFDGEKRTKYVETQALEIKKILGAMGIELEFPQGIVFASFKDEYVNFPLVYICKNVEINIGYINTALKKIVGFLQKRCKEAVLTFKFGFPIDSYRIALISVMGPISYIDSWLDDDLSLVPNNYRGIKKWAESVGEYLKRYTPDFNKPPLAEVLMSTGLLTINRKWIDAKKFTVEYSEEINGHTFQISFNEEDNSNMDKLIEGNIKPSLGYLIEKSRCTKCNQNYKDCDCSMISDEGVAQEILAAIPFPFWTDKSTFGKKG